MIESRRAIKKLDQSVDDLEGSAVHPEVGELIMCNSYSSSGQVANLTSERIDWSIHCRWKSPENLDRVNDEKEVCVHFRYPFIHCPLWPAVHHHSPLPSYWGLAWLRKWGWVSKWFTEAITQMHTDSPSPDGHMIIIQMTQADAHSEQSDQQCRMQYFDIGSLFLLIGSWRLP